MASFAVSIVNMLYLFFLLSLVIVGLVFLTDNIADNKTLIPRFNNTMYQFLYVGLWIVVGVTSVEFLLSIIAVGYSINRISNEDVILLKGDHNRVETFFPSRTSRRSLAASSQKRRSRSR